MTPTQQNHLPAFLYFLMDKLPIGEIEDVLNTARLEPWDETKDHRPHARVALAEEMAEALEGRAKER